MSRRFYLAFFVSILGFIATVLWVTPSHAAITCANVRCAGSCIETPEGPTCTAKLTCANTLCAQGNQCVETASGPTCHAVTAPPRLRPYSGENCHTYKDRYRGYSYYRRDCRARPYVRPDRPRYNRWKPRRHHNNTRRHTAHRHNAYCSHGPQTQPQPAPHPGGFCAKIYKPVCAQKQVQCVMAPCPPVKQTFGNACEASNAGYSIVHQGTCR